MLEYNEPGKGQPQTASRAGDGSETAGKNSPLLMKLMGDSDWRKTGPLEPAGFILVRSVYGGLYARYD
jgi:hypothetical protein